MGFDQLSSASDANEEAVATSTHDKIRVLRMLRHVLLYRRTDNVDLQTVLPGPF